MSTVVRDEPAIWPAPAKLNLMLRVVGRRSDGYHLLQTVFQFLDYCDALRFSVNRDGQVRLHTPLEGVAAEQNLLVRGARLLQERAGITQGADIWLDKRIPMGGGLGGGSSDAATTLVALNRLWRSGWSRAQLAELGLALGADVPIFVHGHAAWAEGVGEQLQPLDLPEPWFLCLTPECHVSTGAVFGAAELTRDAAPIRIADFLAGSIDNSCEPLVRSQYEAVDQAMNWLDQFAKARLTGTGATVFSQFPSQARARAVLERAQQQAFDGFVARGLNGSPLYAL